MRDSRLDKWAELLVHYSLDVQKDHYVLLVSDTAGLPLAEACYESLIKAGAIVETFLFPRAWLELLYQHAGDSQLLATPPAMAEAALRCDRYLAIVADTNPKLLTNIPPDKQTLTAQGRRPILDTILARSAEGEMRWTLTQFPTAGAAQNAEMGTREYEEFIFSLCRLDEEDPAAAWREVERKQQKLIDYLQTKKKLRFRNCQGTDLTVNIEGMKWVNCCGKINFPDGEVYTGPNLDGADGGVNGVARYSFPTLYRNVEVHDIELHFEKGAVVEARASKGEDFLKKMIAQDPGAKFVGEIAIGTNPNMNRITKDILFDEKFDGTFHLALGKGYPQTGNRNLSALHWDIIFDLRNGGTIEADGEVFHSEGKLMPSLLVEDEFKEKL